MSFSISLRGGGGSCLVSLLPGRVGGGVDSFRGIIPPDLRPPLEIIVFLLDRPGELLSAAKSTCPRLIFGRPYFNTIIYM